MKIADHSQAALTVPCPHVCLSSRSEAQHSLCLTFGCSLAGDLSKLLDAFLERQVAEQAQRAGEEDAHMSASSDEDGEESGRGHASGRAGQPDLVHLRQLSAQLLRCRACSVIPLVPVEQLQRLLKALDAHLLRGRDKVLHRREQVHTLFAWFLEDLHVQKGLSISESALHAMSLGRKCLSDEADSN